MISKVSNIIYKIEVLVTTGLLFGIILITTYNMVMRWCGISVGDWFEEGVTTLLSWSVFFGIGAAIKEKHIVVVEVVTQFFSERWRRVIEIFSTALTMLLFSVIWYASIQLTLRLYKSGIVVYTMFDIPVYIVMLCIPISLIIWIFHLLEQILTISRGNSD